MIPQKQAIELPWPHDRTRQKARPVQTPLQRRAPFAGRLERPAHASRTLGHLGAVERQNGRHLCRTFAVLRASFR